MMNEVTHTIEKPRPHSGQSLILPKFKRFNVIANGRRWGKTKLAIKLAMDTMLAGDPVGYFIPSPDYAEDFWEEIKERLEPITIKKSEGKKTIDLITGGHLKIWSMKKKLAGRSKKYKRVIVDEAAFIENLKDAWEQQIRATLTDLEGDAFFLSSPKFGTYFHKVFGNCKKIGFRNWASFQMATHTNPYISKKELDEIKSQTDPLTWAQEFLAKFVNISGRAFAYCFKRKKHVKDLGPLKKGRPVYLAFDFNVDPITAIAAQHADDKSSIYVRHEFRLANSDIWKLCDEIKLRLGDDYYFVVTGDASGKNRSAGMKDGMNYYHIIKAELELKNFQFKIPKKNPFIKNSRVLVNSILYRHPAIHIHPDCEHLINDLELVQVKENGDIDKSNNQLTHLLDAFRYYLNTFFKGFVKLK